MGNFFIWMLDVEWKGREGREGKGRGGNAWSPNYLTPLGYGPMSKYVSNVMLTPYIGK